MSVVPDLPRRDELWPRTIGELDGALLEARLSAAVDVISGSRRTILDAIAAATGRRVESLTAPGHLLLKTSTAGGRPRADEVPADLVEVVARSMRDAARTRPIIIADGPAYDGYELVAAESGYRRVAERLPDVSIRDLNFDETTDVDGFPVARSWSDAALVINVARARTHRRFGVSMAGKSLLGVVKASTPGQPKFVGRHVRVPRLLRRLHAISPPVLHVIDGAPGMEGDGPLDGVPANSRFAVISDSYLAADLQATIEMGFDPSLVPGMFQTIREVSHRTVDWASFRSTDKDYLPSRRCGWLYKSLKRTKRREEHFHPLAEGLRMCWSTENAGETT